MEEEVQLWVAAGVNCYLKQRHEDILQHLLEVVQLFLCVVDVTLREKHKSRSYEIMVVLMKCYLSSTN